MAGKKRIYCVICGASRIPGQRGGPKFHKVGEEKHPVCQMTCSRAYALWVTAHRRREDNAKAAGS